jgi:hypothetical protein
METDFANMIQFLDDEIRFLESLQELDEEEDAVMDTIEREKRVAIMEIEDLEERVQEICQKAFGQRVELGAE